MIEVSTFRALQADAETDEHGRVLRDNVWGNAGGGRRAARLHDQRAVLRPGRRPDPRLPRRRQGPAPPGAADDRRPGRRAIARTRCACCARRASRPRPASPSRKRRARRSANSHRLVHNVPAARLFDEMLKLLQSGHSLESLRAAAPRGTAPRPAAAARRHPRAARRRTLRRGGARPEPTSACSRASRSRRGSCSRRCCGSRCGCAGNSAARTASTRFPALARGDRLGARRAERASSRSRNASSPTCARSGRCSRASSGAPAARRYRLIEHLRFRAGYDFMILRVRCRRGLGRARRLVDQLHRRRRRRAQDAARARALRGRRAPQAPAATSRECRQPRTSPRRAMPA